MIQPGGLGKGEAFRALFFDEAEEHLANIESILLDLEPGAVGGEGLSAIFRAAHSIKGSAAMLGFGEVAKLTHVLENLLDLLRKGERDIVKDDVDAMLAAGDIIKAQIAHRRGNLALEPDGDPAESLLRHRVAAGAGGAPARRAFRVRIGPLVAPLEAAQVDMMLAGLGEMGEVVDCGIDNRAGGLIVFEAAFDGTEFDLRSVVSLVAPPELTIVEKLAAVSPAVRTDPMEQVAAPGVAQAAGAGGIGGGEDEWFVEPDELKRRAREREAPSARADERAAMGSARVESGFDEFVSPESLHGRRGTVPAPAAGSVAAPRGMGRRAADAAPAAEEGRGRRSADRLPAAHGEAGTIRVATEKVDHLVNLVGELVITEAMLARQFADGGTARHGSDGLPGHSGLADLARHTRNLQEAVLAIRMVPISMVFGRFPRLVREMSDQLGKRVELKVSGETTELDRGLIEKISDPLTHLIRNAIDHGLEGPEARAAAGKPPVGVITLSAMQRGGNVVIEVADDGRGMDRERILARAAERGISIAPEASDAEVWQLVFEAGFSTAEAVTELSGRGVGMDVVKRNIHSLGGSVEIDSRSARGSRISVSVPLTLAIMEAMTVSVGGDIYVLPLASVVESRRIEDRDVHVLPGKRETLRVRDDYLTMIRLAGFFPPRCGAGTGDIAVIVEGETGRAAVLVDELVGQQQVVVKSLEANFRRVPGLSGATIMGDGAVALILDLGYLIHAAGRVAAA